MSLRNRAGSGEPGPISVVARRVRAAPSPPPDMPRASTWGRGPFPVAAGRRLLAAIAHALLRERADDDRWTEGPAAVPLHEAGEATSGRQAGHREERDRCDVG